MATPPIKTKFEIDGEREYKAALSDINSGLRVLSSEMNLLKARYADNEGSTEALTAKQDLLNRQIDAQKNKILQLRESMQRSTELYGENDSRTRKWQVSLNSAQTQLANMERELGATDRALGGLGGTIDTTSAGGRGLGDVLDQLAGKLGVTIPEGAKASLNGMMTLNPALVAVGASLAAIVTGAAAAEKALKSITDEAAASADDIMTLSLQTGLATDTIQELRYSAELIDVSFETLQGSMAKMIRNMSSARDGTGNAAEAFAALGVAVTDGSGNLRDSEKVFGEVIDALHGIQNETQRDAYAMAIFGKSAQDLNPLIVQGGDVLARYRKEAEDTSYVLSTDQLAALGAVDDAHQRLINTQKAGKDKLAIEFAPALTKFYTEMGSGWDKLSTDFEKSGLVNVFAALLKCVVALAPAFEDLGDVLVAIKPVFDGLSITLEAVAKFIALIEDATDVIVGTLTLNSTLLNTGLGFYGNSHYQQISNGSDYYSGNKWDPNLKTWVGNGSSNASGDWNFHGGMTWVGENGPEPVWLPRGTRIGTAQEGQRMSGGGDVYYVTIDAKSIQEFNDIARLAREQRVKDRMGGDK